MGWRVEGACITAASLRKDLQECAPVKFLVFTYIITITKNGMWLKIPCHMPCWAPGSPAHRRSARRGVVLNGPADLHEEQEDEEEHEPRRHGSPSVPAEPSDGS